MALPTERPFKSRGAATSGATAKVQENDAERRHASAYRLEHRCLVCKKPKRGAALRASVGVRALPKQTRGSVFVGGKQPARNFKNRKRRFVKAPFAVMPRGGGPSPNERTLRFQSLQILTTLIDRSNNAFTCRIALTRPTYKIRACGSSIMW